MAFVQRSHLLQWRFRDNDGAESTCQTHVPASVSLAAAYNLAAALGPLIASLSDAVLITINVVAQWVETTPVAIPEISDVTRAGVFIWRTGNIPADRYILQIPSFRRQLLLSAGPYTNVAIDPDAPEVAAITDAMVNGVGGVAPVAPWQGGDFSGSAGGSYGGGSASGDFGGGSAGGSWGDGVGSTGPWGPAGSAGGSIFGDWLDRFRFTNGPRLVELRAAYIGRSNERLYIPLFRL
ncbi:MAG: hypothetical protein HC914_16195 [Chloroflexaceae bacterium]|nr:hypothetical protein [Chloroflexaceae bacterium]